MDAFNTLNTDPTLYSHLLCESNAATAYYPDHALQQLWVVDTGNTEDLFTPSIATDDFYQWLPAYATVGTTQIIRHDQSQAAKQYASSLAVSQFCWIRTSYTGATNHTLWMESANGGVVRGIRVTTRSNTLRVRLYADESTTFKDFNTADIGLGDGNLHHVGFTYDEGTDALVLYVDGVEVSPDTGHGDHQDTAGTLFQTNYRLCLNGTQTKGFSLAVTHYADWRAYSRVLTLTEVGTLATGGSGQDVLPERYINRTTGAVVEFSTGPLIDVFRHTAYGLQQEGDNTDVSDAIQWALDNQRRPDPATRVDRYGNPAPGGPPGCFTPEMGANTSQTYWTVLKRLFIPATDGGKLQGGGCTLEFASNNYTGKQCRLFYNRPGSTEPMWTYQGKNWEFTGFGYMGRVEGSGASRPDFGWVNTRVRSSTSDTDPGIHPWYDSTRNNASTRASTRPRFNNVHCAGFTVGMENGRNRYYDGVWANGNNRTAHETVIVGGISLPPVGSQQPPVNATNICGTDPPTSTWNCVTGATNCDFVTMTDCSFNDCAVGFRNVNDQGQLHSFRRVNFRAVVIGIDMWAGGPIRWYEAYHGGGTNPEMQAMLRIGNRTGKNTGSFVISDVKIDQSAETNVFIVEFDDTYGDAVFDHNVHVHIMRGIYTEWAGNRAGLQRFAKLVGGCALTISGFYGLGTIECVGIPNQSGVTLWGPSVAFENCRLLGDQITNPTDLLSGSYSDVRFTDAMANHQYTGNQHAVQFRPDIPRRGGGNAGNAVTWG